jgi:YbgC/YbaW family acyl-CoA thioester hydrolase
VSLVGSRVVVPYRVAFGDTDASGRLYWGAMFRIFERAETELWRSLDALDVYGRIPRVHAEADYPQPMEFDDQLDVTAEIIRLGRTSVELGFHVERAGESVGRGKAVAVYVDETGKPRSLAERLEKHGLENT